MPNLAENDSGRLKNSEGNRNGEWIFCQRTEEGRRCFILGSDKNKKEQKNFQSKLTSQLLPETGRAQSSEP